jgi:pimeloyl-ACP methyl ester carboxylesterase
VTDLLRIPVGPGALHVERFGFGDRAVVFLHGLGTSSFLWRNVVPALPLGRVTAFTLDLFGHGESDRAVDADYGVAAQADYLGRALTVLRIARADIVAVDLGATVALALAARAAGRVQSLVLVNPADPSSPRGDDFAEVERLSARHLLDASSGMMGAASLLGPVLERSVAQPERMAPALIGRYVAPYVGRDGVGHLMQVVRAVNDRALEGVEWEKIVAPTLVLRGEADSWVLPAVSAAIASRLRRGEHRRVAGAARLIPEDAPDLFAELVTEWIGSEEKSA